MKSYDVSIDFGTEDSDLVYVGFGKNDEVKKAINSLSLSAVASLTADIIRFIYESYIGRPCTASGIGLGEALGDFVSDMVTVNHMDQDLYEKEFLE